MGVQLWERVTRIKCVTAVKAHAMRGVVNRPTV